MAALAGNGNGAASGDSPGGGEFQWVYGCSPTTFYPDLDRDGYGSKNAAPLSAGCAGDPTPTGYSAMDGDCDENDEMVHPERPKSAISRTTTATAKSTRTPDPR